jgi:hypothetical protein
MHLADEICAGAEIYFTGRTGSQYLKTAFILCDDYTELASKLYLIEHNSNWDDKRANGSFKGYRQILKDAHEHLTHPTVAGEVQELQRHMCERRKRRNGFFHSADLLDLNLGTRTCIEAFCELFRYCELLFDSRWTTIVAGAGNLETLIALFRLESLAFSDPDIRRRVAHIIETQPSNRSTTRKTGVHVAAYPEDLHLRLCVINRGNLLRDQLLTLLGDYETETLAST